MDLYMLIFLHLLWAVSSETSKPSTKTICSSFFSKSIEDMAFKCDKQCAETLEKEEKCMIKCNRKLITCQQSCAGIPECTSQCIRKHGKLAPTACFQRCIGDKSDESECCINGCLNVDLYSPCLDHCIKPLHDCTDNCFNKKDACDDKCVRDNGLSECHEGFSQCSKTLRKCLQVCDKFLNLRGKCIKNCRVKSGVSACVRECKKYS